MHARAKPLSVAVVVRVKTGEVIGFSVSRLRGHDASQFKYPWPDDDTPVRIPALLRSLKPVLKPGATLVSDRHPTPKWLNTALPDVQHPPDQVDLCPSWPKRAIRVRKGVLWIACQP